MKSFLITNLIKIWILINFFKLFNTINSPELMNGLHEMLVNLIFAVIMDPKESLNNNVTLAFLGSVSEKLRIKCDWSNEAYQTAIQACVRKNLGAGKTSFLDKFYDDKDKRNGPYIRKIIGEIEDITIPSSMFENQVTKAELDVCFRFFNRQDSLVAVIASELSDLHLNDKGMSSFDAFQTGPLRKQLKYCNCL